MMNPGIMHAGEGIAGRRFRPVFSRDFQDPGQGAMDPVLRFRMTRIFRVTRKFVIYYQPTWGTCCAC